MFRDESLTRMLGRFRERYLVGRERLPLRVLHVGAPGGEEEAPEFGDSAWTVQRIDERVEPGLTGDAPRSWRAFPGWKRIIPLPPATPGLPSSADVEDSIPFELRHRLEVRRDVVANRRMRAPAGLDCEDPMWREHADAPKEEGILGGVDVIRDDTDLELVAKCAA